MTQEHDFFGEVTEEAKTKSDFSVFEAGTYEMTVVSAEWGEGKDFDGNAVRQLVVKSTISNPLEEDGAVTDLNGKQWINPSFTQWFQLPSFGWNKKDKQAKIGRQFVTTALGIPEDGDIKTIGMTGNPLIGKKLMGLIEVKNKQNSDEKKNKLNSVKPLKKK